MAALFLPFGALVALGAAPPARAAVGVAVGPRVGLELHEDVDPFVGGDLRLSFAQSPLVLAPSFDWYFDEDKRLFQIGLTALSPLPIRSRLVRPYVGPGIGVTAFSYHEGVPPTDDNGSRIALNLVGGVCFDLPVLTPFVQTMVSIGEFDLVTVGSGVLIAFGREERN